MSCSRCKRVHFDHLVMIFKSQINYFLKKIITSVNLPVFTNHHRGWDRDFLHTTQTLTIIECVATTSRLTHRISRVAVILVFTKSLS